ncbi:hypothetical protein [Planomicrobium sp. CPCC 101110]
MVEENQSIDVPIEREELKG